jgi:hypothetical protein
LPDRFDHLAALDVLERRFDGPIPEEARRIARCGSGTRLRFFEAVGQADFFRRMARGQLDIIRRRRMGGSFYPALVEDLALYRREARRWARLARALRAELSLPLTPPSAPGRDPR